MKGSNYEQIISETMGSQPINSVVDLSKGLDFDVYEINESYVFRFAKNALSAAKLRSEFELLDSLITYELPLEIPCYSYRGIRYGHAFGCYQRIAGSALRIVSDKNQGNFDKIDQMLRIVGGIKAPSHQRLFYYNKWQSYFLKLIENVGTHGFSMLGSAKREYLKDFFASNTQAVLCRPFQLGIVHSDLKADHLICNSDNQLVGVVDWGDATFGDPLFDYARLIDAFGPRDSFSVTSNHRFNRREIHIILFYTLLIPFISILRGIKDHNADEARYGLDKFGHLAYYRMLLDDESVN